MKMYCNQLDFFQKSYSYIEELGKPYRLMINAQLNELNPATFNLWEGKKYKSNVINYKKDYNGLPPNSKIYFIVRRFDKDFLVMKMNLVVDLTMGSGSRSTC